MKSIDVHFRCEGKNWTLSSIFICSVETRYVPTDDGSCSKFSVGAYSSVLARSYLNRL
jgi:hypothetical protein